MSESKLEHLTAAASNEEPDRVAATIEALEGWSEAERHHERKLTSLAIATRMASEPDDEAWIAAGTFLDAVRSVEAARIDVQRACLEYVLDLAGAAPIEDAVDQLQTERRLRLDAADELRARRDAITMPPLLHLRSIDPVEVPFGQSISQESAVSNVGGSTASAMTVSVDAPVASSVTPSTLTPLAPDQDHPIVVEVAGSEPGTASVVVSVDPDEADANGWGATTRFPVDVITRQEYLQRAIDILAVTVAIATDAAAQTGIDRGIPTQLDRIQKQLTAIADRAGQRNPGRRGDVDTDIDPGTGTGTDPGTTTRTGAGIASNTGSGTGTDTRANPGSSFEAGIGAVRNRLGGVHQRLATEQVAPPMLVGEIRPRLTSVDQALDGALRARWR